MKERSSLSPAPVPKSAPPTKRKVEVGPVASRSKQPSVPQPIVPQQSSFAQVNAEQLQNMIRNPNNFGKTWPALVRLRPMPRAGFVNSAAKPASLGAEGRRPKHSSEGKWGKFGAIVWIDPWGSWGGLEGT